MKTIEISENIKKERKIKNLTQKQLAEMLNISHDTISLWELGKSIPDLESLITLAKIFEISIEDLIGQEDFSSSVRKNIVSDELSEEEIEMIKGIRELNFTDQNALKVVINSFLSKNSTVKEKIKQ